MIEDSFHFVHAAPDHHHDGPSVTSFSSNDPTANERVIILPGGRAMVVDWGIESFVKNFVAIAISGAVIIGAAAYGLIWADKKLKQRKQPPVRVGPPAQQQAPSDNDDHSSVSSDN